MHLKGGVELDIAQKRPQPGPRNLYFLLRDLLLDVLFAFPSSAFTSTSALVTLHHSEKPSRW